MYGSLSQYKSSTGKASDLDWHVVRSVRQMISAAKGRLFCAQMHLKVLEKINVLKKKTRGCSDVIIIFNISLKPYSPKGWG